MTNESTGGIKNEKSKLRRYYYPFDDRTVEALKKYFGVEDYAALLSVMKDVGLKDNSSRASFSTGVS
jgi:hypothetical protein